MGHEIVNLCDGAKVETWTDGDTQVLAVTNIGCTVMARVPSHDMGRLVWALSPLVGANFERARSAGHALYELSYPAARAEELREIAAQLDEPGCDDPCTQHRLDRGDFCRCFAGENLRKLADALDLKAKVEAERKNRWRWLRWLGYRAFMPVWPRLAVRCLRPEEIPF